MDSGTQGTPGSWQGLWAQAEDRDDSWLTLDIGLSRSCRHTYTYEGFCQGA